MSATSFVPLRPLCDTRPARGKHRAPGGWRRFGASLVDDLRASARAAYGSAVLCSGLLVGLVGVAGGVRL